jgi:hypothetical protein
MKICFIRVINRINLIYIPYNFKGFHHILNNNYMIRFGYFENMFLSLEFKKDSTIHIINGFWED